MEYPVASRNEVRFRGRDFSATEADMAAFIADLLAAFPEARLFHDLNSQWQDYPEISAAEAARLFGAEKNLMVIFDPKWKANTKPYGTPDRGYNVLNVPFPLVRFRAGSIETRHAEELGRSIRICRNGSLDGQCAIRDKEDARVVDKVLRIHRKHVHKRAERFDLVTGKFDREDTCTYWYGPDIGRRSREEEDLFLQVRYYRDIGKFWGYKAAKP